MFGIKKEKINLIELRDGIYAPDLLIAAIGWFDFFNWLSKNPSDKDNICKTFGIKNRPADVMITLFLSMGLIQYKNNCFIVTEYTKKYLLDKSRFNLCPYLASLKERPICKNIFQVLKTDKPIQWGGDVDKGKEWAMAMEKEDFANFFTDAMNSRGSYLAPALAKKLKCKKHYRLLDIAGGSGIYACAIAKENRHIRAAVFEKQPVDKVTEYTIIKNGMADKISVVAGDIFKDEFPLGYDIHLFSHVLHDWGEKSVFRLLKKSYDTLPKDGMIVIFDAHINSNMTGPLSVAAYSVLLMISTEGKCYSIKEINDLLLKVGFKDIKFIPIFEARSIITAKK